MDRKITKLNVIAPLPKLKRVAAYARVSGGSDDMLHSLAAQVEYYTSLIRNNPDWVYSGIYADEAKTGTKSGRSEFQRLIADCRAGLIDEIITKSVSRFARNTVTLLETVRELKSLGIGVYFEEQRIHTLSADGELLLTIIASYAQEESRSVSENCKWRIRKNFMEGKPTNIVSIYGYDRVAGKLIIKPDEAEVVRMIFADYLSGLGKNAIMKKLNRLGIPAKNGGQWSESTINDIIKNEKYTGDMCLQKGYIADHISKRYIPNNGELPKYYVDGSHEAIINTELFEAVQKEISNRAEQAKIYTGQPVGDFTGKIRCGRCGAYFRRKTSASGTKYAKTIWICATLVYKGKHKCAAKRIREDILIRKCAEVLGINEYDPVVFKKKISAVNVPDDGILVFVFKDGTERMVYWENPSRAESWTDEMKENARKKVNSNG